MELLKALEMSAAALKKWCNDKEGGFRDVINSGELDKGLTPDALRAKIAELKAFRNTEKPPKAADKAKLVDEHAALESRLLEQQANGTTPEDAVAKMKEMMDGASPTTVQGVWNDMETAEREYEALLLLKLAEAERLQIQRATDLLADPLMSKTDALLSWIAAETAKLVEGRQPENLGADSAAAAALLKKIESWAAEEKPPKEAEKNGLQEGLRDIMIRRGQEGRDPLPEPYSVGALEGAWTGLEDALAALLEALAKRQREMAHNEKMAATDALKAAVDELAAKWKKEVDDEASGLRAKVANGELGNSQAETQKLLDDYRKDHVGTKKPKWADQKADIEAKRRDVDARRADEGREPAVWEPSGAALSSAWSDLAKDGAAYEKALLDKLGQLKEEEKERLRRLALLENAKSRLAELLPPMVARADTVDDSVKVAEAKAAAAAKSLQPWVEEARARLQGKLAALTEGGPTSDEMAGVEASNLLTFDEVEKPPRSLEFLQLQEAVNDAIAAGSAQRYAGTPAKANASKAIATLAAIKAEWDALESAEAGLRAELWRIKVKVQGPALLWERLRRGCKKVSEWLLNTAPLIEKVGTTATSEGEAATWLHIVEGIYAELLLEKRVVESLTKLADTLSMQEPDYTARAKGALDTTNGVSSMGEMLKGKLERLKEELARQRRLAHEKVLYATRVASFALVVEDAVELTAFPIPSIDTVKTIKDLTATGTAQGDELMPAPEGADPSSIERAEFLKVKWTQLLSMLSMKAAEYESVRRASISAGPLQSEQASTTMMFNAWYERCTDLLLIEAAPADATPPQLAHVAKGDIERAVAVAESQAAEGEVHMRRLDDITRQLAALGVQGITAASDVATEEMVAATLTDEERVARSDHVKTLSKQLRRAVAAAPSDVPAPVLEVVQELKNLAEGSAGPGTATTVSLLGEYLQAPHAAFVIAHVPTGAAGALGVDSFDPFPLDRSEAASRPLPEKLFSPEAHGFSVLAALNRARTTPKAFAAELKQSFDGRFEGTVLTPPWGGMRLRTQEGAAALDDLIAHLNNSPELPAVKLVPAVCEASQELAAAMSAGGTPPGLDERLKPRGKFNGFGGEVMLMGVRQPEAIAIMALLCDGDKSRQNRDCLLRQDVGVGGIGLTEHADYGSVATITLLTLFATALNEKRTVECEGVATKALTEILDAIPSSEMRAMVLDGLAAQKKVKVEYEVTQATITVYEPSGTGQAVAFRWE